MDGTDAFSDVLTLMGQSEYVKAYDLARRAVEGGSENVALRHRGVLALARMGATARAKRQFRQWRLDEVPDDEDVLSLWGRLLKDEAETESGAAREAGLLTAAAAYERAFHAAGSGYYPAINVASLNALAGHRGVAEGWARIALEAAELGADYYSLATVAEAQAVLRDAAAARAALDRAVAAPDAKLEAISTTRGQIARLVEALELDPELLAPLALPLVVHYCGHMVSPDAVGGRFPESEVPRVARDLASWFSRNCVAHMVGSLASGADILIAEAGLAAGCALDVVMPFAKRDFIEVSVRPAGENWVGRFLDVIEAAKAVHFVTEDDWLGHDELFAYASHLALGLARLRAQSIGTEVHQLAVWDGRPARPQDRAGTARDLAIGRQLGIAQHVIRVNEAPTTDAENTDRGAAHDAGAERVRRTMVFGDLKGFSKLRDAQLQSYVKTVLGACAGVLAHQGATLRFRNTWGDGLFLVFDDPAAAADCAFELQEAVTGIDRAASGLPDDLGLRLGMHYGPVFEAEDPVLARTNCFGSHVSRAARVEPITPEGEVYVTEATAAALAVDAPDRFRCDYVGRVPLAKGYGEFPMYSLVRRGGGLRANAAEM